jgi:hypothetical protein
MDQVFKDYSLDKEQEDAQLEINATGEPDAVDASG